MLTVVVELSNSHVRLTLISKVAFFFIPSQISGNWSLVNHVKKYMYIFRILTLCKYIYFFLFAGFTLIAFVFPFLGIFDLAFLVFLILSLSFFFLIVFFSFSNNLVCSFLLALKTRNIVIRSKRRKSKPSNAGTTYARTLTFSNNAGTIGWGPLAMNQSWLHPSQ